MDGIDREESDSGDGRVGNGERNVRERGAANRVFRWLCFLVGRWAVVGSLLPLTGQCRAVRNSIRLSDVRGVLDDQESCDIRRAKLQLGANCMGKTQMVVDGIIEASGGFAGRSALLPACDATWSNRDAVFTPPNE